MTQKSDIIDMPWLADFSDPVRIFTIIVVAEIMVVIYSLSFLSFDYAYLNRLAVISLLAQLIAINTIVMLSKARHVLNKLPIMPGVLLVLVLTFVMAAVYTWVMAWIDASLDFGWFNHAALTTVKISLATSLTFLTLLRYFYVQNQWAYQVQALAKAQMNALQARIKPHFLYNSLNSIASLIAFDPPAAERAVLNLSGLFRKAFTDRKNSITTLAKELEWIGEYLAIEKLRLMDRLEFNKQVDEHLLETEIPLLTIQPLIENAVIHGIQNLSDGGVIDLRIKDNGHGFLVRVQNPYRKDKVRPGNQTGLDNIQQRLKLFFGDAVKFETDDEIDFIVQWEVKT